MAMTLHSAQLLQIHTLRSKLSFTYRPVSWLMCSILMWYANYTFERTGCPDSISLTSIRQLLRLLMSINIFDAYQHPGKWCEVVSPMCTPSNRLCETTATCWYLTSHGKASTIYLSIISGLQRARRDYLLTRHRLRSVL